MAGKRPTKTKADPAVATDTSASTVRVDQKAKLKWLGGSDSDAFNNVLVNSAVTTLWRLWADNEEYCRKQRSAVAAALKGIAPRDEMEGMLAAQLVAANAAAMECYRRAMIPEQPFAGRQENLNQANKLSRTYATLLEALNRHRGKSTQQRVTVEHVHVHAGGQAVVGAVQAGGGSSPEIQGQPHAQSALAHAPVAALRSKDEDREVVPLSRDAERPVPNARRKIARCATG